MKNWRLFGVSQNLACSSLSVSGDDRKAGGRRAGSGRKKGEVKPSPFLSRIPLVADPARRPPAFSRDRSH